MGCCCCSNIASCFTCCVAASRHATACCCSAMCCWLSAVCCCCNSPSAVTHSLKTFGCTGPSSNGCCRCTGGGYGGGVGCSLFIPLGAVCSGCCLALRAAATVTAFLGLGRALRKPKRWAFATGRSKVLMGTHFWPWTRWRCGASPSSWNTGKLGPAVQWPRSSSSTSSLPLLALGPSTVQLQSQM